MCFEPIYFLSSHSALFPLLHSQSIYYQRAKRTCPDQKPPPSWNASPNTSSSRLPTILLRLDKSVLPNVEDAFFLSEDRILPSAIEDAGGAPLTMRSESKRPSVFQDPQKVKSDAQLQLNLPQFRSALSMMANKSKVEIQSTIEGCLYNQAANTRGV